MRMPVGGFRADQVCRLDHPNAGMAKSHKSDNHVRTHLRLRHVSFLVEWDLFLLLNAVAREIKIKKKTWQEESCSAHARIFTVILRILLFWYIYIPPPRCFYFKLSHPARGAYMANVPISSLGWKKTKSQLHPPSEMSCDMWRADLWPPVEKEEWRLNDKKKRGGRFDLYVSTRTWLEVL